MVLQLMRSGFHRRFPQTVLSILTLSLQNQVSIHSIVQSHVATVRALEIYREERYKLVHIKGMYVVISNILERLL